MQDPQVPWLCCIVIIFPVHKTISEIQLSDTTWRLQIASVQVSDGFKVSFIASPPVSQRPKATAMNPPVVEFTTHQGDLVTNGGWKVQMDKTLL